MITFEDALQKIDKMSVLIETISEKIKKLEVPKHDSWISSEEAAKYTGYEKSTILDYKHEIKFHQRNKKILFRKSDLDRWMDKYKN